MTEDAGGTAGDVPLDIAGHDRSDRTDAAATGAVDPGENGASEGVVDDLSTVEANRDSNGTTGGNGDGDGTGGDREDDRVEPVELLVGMAKEGEIDPWDIDIVAVTDEFLARLDESDLRTGGRALFYASVLLRMKSDAMVTDEEPPAGEAERAPGDPFEAAEGSPDPIASLEREMDRRLERKHARGTPRTLDELVRELREHERSYKQSRSYDTSDSPRGFQRGTQTLDYRSADDFRPADEPTEADVTGTTHDEHMEDLISEVYVALHEQYDRGREEVLFREVREAAGSIMNTFLALLFLSHRGQVRLQQDEFFGDLWIRDPAAVADGEEAVAD
jgi:segregation and condensation protein A